MIKNEFPSIPIPATGKVEKIMFRGGEGFPLTLDVSTEVDGRRYYLYDVPCDYGDKGKHK